MYIIYTRRHGGAAAEGPMGGVAAAEGPTEPPQRDRWGVSAAEGPMGPPHRGPWTHGPIGPTGPYGPMDPWAHRPYSWGFVYYLYSI